MRNTIDTARWARRFNRGKVDMSEYLGAGKHLGE